MEKGINLRINEFKASLEICINDAKLPPGIVQPILQNVLNQVISANATAIMQEKASYEEEGEKDGKEIHKA